MKHVFLSGCLALVCLGVGARADASPEAARRILAANQDTLVIVEGVLKMETLVDGTRRGREREVPVNASGFLVHTSGLALVSTVHLNPLGVMNQKPIRMERDGRTFEFQVRTRLENLRLRLRNRAEFAARVALEDPDLGLMLLAAEPSDGGEAAAFRAVDLNHAAAATAFTEYLVVDQGEGTFRNEVVLESGVISGLLPEPRAWYLQDLGRSWMFVGAPFFDLDGGLLGMGLLHVRPAQNPTARTADSQPVPAIVPAADIRSLVARAVQSGESAAPEPVAQPCLARLADLSAERAAAVVASASNAVVVVEGSVRYKCGRCAEEHEGEIETVGTVLDPAGLVVISNEGDSQGNQYLEQQLRCIRPDGSEVPVEIRLHDDDLMLTVLAPSAHDAPSGPPAEFKALRPDPAVRAELLDDVITLGRLGKENRYALSVSVGHITSRTAQPRVFYQLYSLPPALSDEGLPVLTAEGALLGVTATDPHTDGGDNGEGDAEPDPRALRRYPARVVPAAALLELLEHARKAPTGRTETARN